MPSLLINVVTDNNGWQLRHSKQLTERLCDLGHHARLKQDYDDVEAGDIAFYLGCLRLTPNEILMRNRTNLIVHASDLPKGRGFSPWTWMILEGENKIPVCLLDAEEQADSGAIHYKDWIIFRGDELIDELRDAIGAKAVELCLRFVQSDPTPPRPQTGETSTYPRRRPIDSEIDPERPISEIFNQFRVADNDAYPVFFHHLGCRYVLKITKSGD